MADKKKAAKKADEKKQNIGSTGTGLGDEQNIGSTGTGLGDEQNIGSTGTGLGDEQNIGSTGTGLGDEQNIGSTGTGLGDEQNIGSTGTGLGDEQNIGSTGTGLGDEQNIGSTGTGLGDEDEIIPKIGIIGHGPVCVCIPFLQSAAQGVELMYALRSMERNFREDFKVVIIGDRPEWLSDEAIHISAECVSKNPQIDTTSKLFLAIASEEVSEKFIWSNDDIYFNTPVLLADIEMLSTQGKLLEVPGATEAYKANRNDTIKVLQQMKLKTRNFDMHTPVLYDKNKLMELIEQLQNMNAPEGVLIPSIYFNKFYADHSATDHDGKTGNYLLRIVTANTDPKVFAEFIQGKKFLNNAESGWNALLQNYLQKRFPEKSKFEI